MELFQGSYRVKLRLSLILGVKDSTLYLIILKLCLLYNSLFSLDIRWLNEGDVSDKEYSSIFLGKILCSDQQMWKTNTLWFPYRALIEIF
jgi:hypothetical protein